MTKKEKNKLEEIHGGDEIVKISSEHNQDENVSTTQEVIHYKRGYMAHKHNGKLGHCSECKNQSVSHEEFDKMVEILLNTPPRKRTKKDRNKKEAV
nr:12352_t:CDS:2 [Entrophospora candida]